MLKQLTIADFGNCNILPVSNEFPLFAIV